MADGQAPGFSLTFGAGAAKHRQKRVRVAETEEAPKQDFVTGFSETGLRFRDGGGPSSGTDGAQLRVIPNQGNDMRNLNTGPRAHNPNRFLPQRDDIQRVEAGEDRFEVAAPEERTEVRYGLTTFRDDPGAAETAQANGTRGDDTQANGRGVDGAAEDSRTNGGRTDATANGHARRGTRVVGSGRDWETEAFQSDVGRLPDQASLEEYEAMPVEAFGAAMLRGMGWREEQESVEAQAKEFVRRAPLLGLGATSAPPARREKRFIKPGESREPARDLVVYGADGRIKHTRAAGEALVERVPRGAAAGKRMRVSKGRHAGLMCTVVAVQPEVAGQSQRADVRLIPSEERVVVRIKDLIEREDPWPSGAEQPAERPSRPAAAAAADGSLRADAPAGAGPLDRAPKETSAERPWLAPHIRIKVIDKRLGKGRLYLKKGEITDVLTPTTCALALDSGDRVDAAQAQLETVVPRREGARLLVVAGRLRGSRARLLRRDGESARVTLQVLEDFSVHELAFDEVAEFVGDLGDEE